MPKLATYVYVDSEVYGPHDDVPADIARRITNPDAWEGGEVPAFEPASEPAPTPAPSGDAPTRVPAPPRAGRGSGVDAWATFAKASGVEVDADATRDEIIAACEQAGVIDADGQ